MAAADTDNDTVDYGENGMSTDLEQALRRALDATGDVIQQPRDDLTAHVVRRYRRRRIAYSGAAGAAVLAVAVAIAGLFGAARDDGPDRTVNPSTPTPTPSATQAVAERVLLDPAVAQPVQIVWPQAIRNLPARLPNGSEYSPLEEVADGVFVVQAKLGFERTGSVYRFTPATGELKLLIDARKLNPSTTRVAPVGKAWVIDGGTMVAVQTLEADGQSSIMYVASVADGSRVTQTNVPGATGEVGFLAWAQDHIVWEGDDGLYSAADPLRLIPGSEGYRLIGQGAWAVEDTAPGIRWWNVATGERHEATAGDASPCYGTTCMIGIGGPSSTSYDIVGFRGPTGRAALVTGYSSASRGSWGDHFALIFYGRADDSDQVVLLFDLRTKKFAMTPYPRTESEQMATAGSNMNLLVLSSSSTAKVVINLNAIN